MGILPVTRFPDRLEPSNQEVACHLSADWEASQGNSLGPHAPFEVAPFSSLSAKYFVKKGISSMILVVEYLGERAGERGQ